MVGPKPSVDIVIVNWNSASQLNQGLESIAKADKEGFWLGQIVVVDNASTEFYINEELQRTLPLDTVRNTANMGFAAACNQGAIRCAAKYILFLNPDVRLKVDTLSDTVRWMEEASGEIGICGIKLINEDDRWETSCARFPDLRMYLGTAFGLDKIIPRSFPGRFLDPSMLERSGYVDQVSGAYFFVRRAVYDVLGGFDERFFVYYEEVDFSLRARRAGYRSYYIADTSAHHIGGASSAKAGPKRLYYYFQSRLRFAEKHFPPVHYLIVQGLTLGPEFVLRSFRSLRPGNSHLTQTLAAYSMLWAWIFGGAKGRPNR